MLTIPRQRAEQLKKVFRQALSTNSRSPMPPLEFVGNRFGLRVRCHTREAAAEFRLEGDQEQETILAPWDLLTDTAGSGRERVIELRRENGHVLASWQNGNVPRAVQYDTPVENEAPWPDSPERFVENPPELLAALGEAAATSDTDSPRYALSCLQLSGNEGKIVATDGHHLLMQRGFEFPWEGELLVPASRVFGSAQVDANGPVFIGKTADWFTLQAGQWTFWLKINKDGRFPTVEQHIAKPEAAVASVELSASDRAFLAANLPNLPGDDLPHTPVTLDVNGTVTVRAQGQDATNQMELALTSTTCQGEPVRVVVNRAYLTRAARLGFERLYLFNNRGALMAADDSRRYVWMPVDPKMAVEPAENITRIESPVPGTVASTGPHRPSSIRNNNTPMARSSTTSNDSSNGNAQAADNDDNP